MTTDLQLEPPSTAVRRADYAESDEAAAMSFIDGQTHGYLGFTRPDGWPGMVAVNFVRAGNTIYFHGAPEGEKMASLALDPRVVFTVADNFSLIPSYFRDTDLACPATQYYRAVLIRSRARVVTSAEEKARALQALMEKLQPEGGYVPIAAGEPRYRKSLATTAVVAVPIVEWTAKFKFGQNLPKAKRRRVAARLEARDEGRDHETVAAMQAKCPF